MADPASICFWAGRWGKRWGEEGRGDWDFGKKLKIFGETADILIMLPRIIRKSLFFCLKASFFLLLAISFQQALNERASILSLAYASQTSELPANQSTEHLLAKLLPAPTGQRAKEPLNQMLNSQGGKSQDGSEGESQEGVSEGASNFKILLAYVSGTSSQEGVSAGDSKLHTDWHSLANPSNNKRTDEDDGSNKSYPPGLPYSPNTVKGLDIADDNGSGASSNGGTSGDTAGDNGSGASPNRGTPGDSSNGGTPKNPTNDPDSAQSSGTCSDTDSLSELRRTKSELEEKFEGEGGDIRLNEFKRNPNTEEKEGGIICLSDDETATKEKDCLTKLKREIRSCESEITQKTAQDEKCETARESLKTSKREYYKQCRLFSRGKQCEETLIACASCPAPDEDSSQYDCVRTHRNSKCPELSGENLKQSQERKEEHEDALKELQEEISELSTEVTEKENDLHRELAELEEEFNSLVQDMERDTRNAKAELEEGMKSAKSKIDANMAAQIQAVQKEIDQSLQIAHEFENAVTKASMVYQVEIQKINDECLNQAHKELRQYRRRRRRSIQSGGYKLSLSQLTKRSRMPFAQQDQIWLNNAKQRCLSGKAPAFSFAQKKYKNTLRQIEQKKEQYQQRITKLQQSLAGFNQAVSQQKNQLVQEYSKQMSDIITQFESNYQSALANYDKNKQTLLFTKNKELSQLKAQLMEKIRLAQDKKMSLARENYLIRELESKNTPSNDDNNEELFSTATSLLIEYQDNLDSAMERCGCKTRRSSRDKSSKNTAPPEPDICKEIKPKEKQGDRFKRAVRIFGGQR